MLHQVFPVIEIKKRKLLILNKSIYPAVFLTEMFKSNCSFKVLEEVFGKCNHLIFIHLSVDPTIGSKNTHVRKVI